MQKQNSECLAIDEQCGSLPEGWKQGARSKKVLLVSYYFPPCVYGYAIRVYNFSRYLACFGWKPYILTVDPVYYKEKNVDSQHFASESSSKILRTGSLEPRRSLFKTFYLDKSNPLQNRNTGKETPSAQLKNTKNHFLIPDNQILWLPNAVLGGRRFIKKEGIDLIYVTSPPFSSLLVGYLLKKATGKPLLFEYRDTWQDNLNHRQGLSGFRRKIEEYMEKIAVRNADRIVVVTEGMKKNLMKKFPGESEEKFQVIRNGFDPILCNNLNIQVPEKNDVFTITYSGSLEYDRDPREFLLAMKELFNEHPEAAQKIRVDLIGNTEQAFAVFVREQSLTSNVRFLGYLPYEENVKHLAASDLLYLMANDIRPDSIPGKLYEYLLLNKPILALVGNNVSGDFLAPFPRACVVKPHDRAGMKAFVWKSFQNYVKNSRHTWKYDKATLKYCRKNQTRQLTELFYQVCT